ncbi:MAG: hypothetical protein H7A21_00075 [Spirochaetales bacterium]|nr:hypothetical protein [Leptospiraceae bacterium]MCP5479806.1 hypothetical protein [Spirochaetales bacterium]MCP5486196.1 hypothetical protein [Spirochaetales bacterium]
MKRKLKQLPVILLILLLAAGAGVALALRVTPEFLPAVLLPSFDRERERLGSHLRLFGRAHEADPEKRLPIGPAAR